MAKKKKNNNENHNTNSEINENNSHEGEKKKKEGVDAEKNREDKGPVTVVLKVDMNCDGCASKIVKCVRAFEGVETVKAETAANKLTIVGAVDPSEIQVKLNQKTKKKVELVSPQPKKDKDKDKDKGKEPKEDNKSKDKIPNDKKPKEAPMTTAVLKLGLNCNGCIDRIHKIVSKTKGVIEMSVDKQKELVTVRGTMDAQALTENLKEKLKKAVEIVPPKTEKEKKDSNGGDNNSGGGGKKKKGGGDAGGNGGQEAEGGSGGGKMEGSKMEYMGIPGPGYGYGYGYQYQMPAGYGYGYQYQMPGGYGYDYGYPAVGGYHAPPQMFSDENPNACAVM